MKNWYSKIGYVFLATSLLGGGTYVALALVEDKLDTVDEIRIAQEDFYQRTGSYLQVISDSKTNPRVGGTVKEKLGKNVSSEYQINEYIRSDGAKGFEIIWKDNTGIHSRGYGPEAGFRTWDKITVSSTTQ